MNKDSLDSVQYRQRIVEENNGLLFNKIDPVRQLDLKKTYSHYDPSIESFNRRIIDKIAKKYDAIPEGS